MRYYISDLHFGHANLNDHMDMRGFPDVEAMNEYMIKQWNSRVREGDEVVILGDFCVYTKAADVEMILRRLRGRKQLIRGNHDSFLGDKNLDSSLFQWIENYKEVKDNRRKVILSHYPVFCYNGQYQYDEKGNPKTYMLYGHVHNTYDEILVNRFIRETRESQRTTKNCEEPRSIPCQMINCFCMFSDYVPLTLDEWIQVDAKRRERMNRV